MYTTHLQTQSRLEPVANWQKMHQSLTKVYKLKKKENELAFEMDVYKAQIRGVMEKQKVRLLDAVMVLSSLPEFKVSPSLTMRLYAAGYELHNGINK